MSEKTTLGFFSKISSFRPWTFGLDIAGGSYLIYEVDTSQINGVERESVLNGLRDVIERRVNIFGVSEPRVFITKSWERSRLVIELAGVKDIKQAIQEIGETPFLEFREVIEKPKEKSEEGEMELIGNSASTTIDFLPTALNGRFVKGAQVSLDNISGEGVVNIQFNNEGGKLFAEITERNIGKPLAIFLDNELLQMPTVQTKIEGGNAQITGNFTVKEAKGFVERFNAGALPAPITLVNQQTISPELGKDSLQKALLAGSIGTLLVILFMIGYYRKMGVFASIALLMYIALTLGIFKIIPITLTLSGIAGFILSIGMAVDANILVFERTKEELKKGRERETAIEEGFKRAWTSIRDSNISTIITSLTLYYFTSSFVKGFALALLIGVLISMFSAITITRALLRIFLKKS